VTKAALQERYPCGGLHVGVSDVVLPPDAFLDSPRRFDFDECRIVNVGTMAQLYKNQDVLIAAAARCLRDGVRVRLLLVGGGKFRSYLERQAQAHGIGHIVEFAGEVMGQAEVRPLLDRSHLFVLPSRTEGLPRALVEAMARGLPSIASRVGGIPELLDLDCLVPPDDVEELSARIASVIRDRARMHEMSCRNLAKAHEYEDSRLDNIRLEYYRRARAICTDKVNDWRSSAK
jgi:glycosyltransferase involved in cell wall biosynthesis